MTGTLILIAIAFAMVCLGGWQLWRIRPANEYRMIEQQRQQMEQSGRTPDEGQLGQYINTIRLSGIVLVGLGLMALVNLILALIGQA